MGGNAWTWYNHFVFKNESNLSRMLTQREEKNREVQEKNSFRVLIKPYLKPELLLVVSKKSIHSLCC